MWRENAISIIIASCVGDYVIQACELNSLPKDVCKECGGLPIVICTIAKALRNKSRPSAWKVALQELKAPSPTKFIGFLEKEYVKIALSYNYLRNDELKKTFLISSLMKNNTSISNLFRHVVGLDILQGANLKMEEARDRLDKLVCELKDSCLLLDGFTTGQFAMHDVIRSVAITIAYTDYHVFTERNDVEKEWKDKDKLKKCTKISLRPSSTIISQLWPEDLDCPNLEYFCMTNIWNTSFQVPEDFFRVMPKLKVLNLFEMQQLPLSLDLLTNLQTLCLDQSKIEYVVIIGKLKKLKVLSLRHSYIKELPTEIGQLTQLRILDLRYCWQLKYIAPNVISKLSRLEELYIKGCPIQWKVEIVEEFKHLAQVTTLTLVIKDDVVLPQGFFSRDLKRYEISIGHSLLDPQEREFTRVLKFKFNSTISLEDLRRIKNVEFLWLTESLNVENGVYNSEMRPLFEEQVIFPDLKVLALTNIKCRKIWDSQLPTSSCQNLTKLTLMSCRNITYVFPSFIAKSLWQLQELEIRDCKVLEEIVAKEEGANAVVSFVFPNVTIFKLEDLPQLTVFYPGIHTLKLPMLKELIVMNCGKFSSINLDFQENDKEGETHISEPKSLFLDNKINSDLEELKLTEMKWQNRSKTLDINFDKSANIPFALLERFKNLEGLKLSCCEYKEIFSCGKDEKQMQITLRPSLTSFQNLKVMEVYKCNRLMKLITSSTARSLVQLREMSIKDCEMLIEIVENEGDATRSIEIVFDNLKKLSLTTLKSLTCFCSGNYFFNFPSLEELIIRICPNMKTFSQGILSTPKLHKVNYDSLENIFDWEEMTAKYNLHTITREAYKKKVRIKLFKDVYANTRMEDEEHAGALSKLKDLKYIWKQDSQLNSSLQNLDCLEVQYCHNLMTLLPSSTYFENLTTLTVTKCNGMQNLMSFSIAKSMVQLKYLSIQGCEMMIEVLANEGDVEKSEFVFEKLKELCLSNLESLTCFCSGNYTLKFPILESLFVCKCFKMKTFFGGGLSMPRLKTLNDKTCSKSDIDTISTISLSEQTRISLTELGRSLKFSLRCKTSSSQRDIGKDDDEALVSDVEIVQQWAAIERLPTFDWLKASLFNKEGEEKVVDGEGKRVVDVTKLGPVERRAFIEKLIKHIEHDNLKLLGKIRERIELVGVALPIIEVRYKNFNVEANCEIVHGKPLPTLWDSLKLWLLVLSKLKVQSQIKLR
ncbi:uncharacterized protein LOC116131798 [Pistacia vera]|uniref:uncharacterized protein LOC116131798 n=1 Tax=Pistacia vera TaxID=55513 RepID=UPI001263AD36|nr:uncharacterized protein LOC116131798 [Pistacia vera]